MTPPSQAAPPTLRPDAIRNRTFDEIAVGDEAAIERTLTARDIQLFAVLSGDNNPQHLDAEFAASTRFHGVIAHGMWAATLISTVLGTRLPGAGTIYLGQTVRFLAPVRIDDVLTVRVKVIARDPVSKRLRLACTGVNQVGTAVIDGEAEVIAPTERIERPGISLPIVMLVDASGQSLLEKVRSLEAIRVAVVHPCNEDSLAAVLDARASGLIDPVIVAPRDKLQDIARKAGLDLAGVRIIDVAHSHAAAARAVALAAAGEVEVLMKGSLHVDELMRAVVASDSGLRTARRISHCFLMHSPAYARPFILTDAMINIAPTLDEKADIVRNAIDLAGIVGVAVPRVAILAAVEEINVRMPATLDAAALCKMVDRGQITGCILDGPLAFDNAISAAAARTNGIVSPVAGIADIFVVPDVESGNLLARQLEYLGGASSAGIVMGARVPIILASGADSRETRIASCVLASLVAHHYRAKPP